MRWKAPSPTPFAHRTSTARHAGHRLWRKPRRNPTQTPAEGRRRHMPTFALHGPRPQSNKVRTKRSSVPLPWAPFAARNAPRGILVQTECGPEVLSRLKPTHTTSDSRIPPPPPSDALEGGGGAPLPPPECPAYATAFETDSHPPQPLWQPPPTACLTACGVPSLPMHPCRGGWGWHKALVVGGGGGVAARFIHNRRTTGAGPVDTACKNPITGGLPTAESTCPCTPPETQPRRPPPPQGFALKEGGTPLPSQHSSYNSSQRHAPNPNITPNRQ